MNCLKHSLPLILIASALLLSAAGNVVANSPNRGDRTDAQTRDDHDQGSRGAGTLPQHEPASPPAAEAREGETYNYYGTFNYVPPETQRPRASGGIPWERIGQVSSVVATVAVALFTLGLWVTSIWQWRAINRQATLMEAGFDQWIDLVNWRCADKPRDGKLQICVDLVNPTGFPMTFAGYVAVAEIRHAFEDEILSPKNPKSISFDKSVAGHEYDAIHTPVIAQFSHVHKITKKRVTIDWEGTLDCTWFGGEHKWHVAFTRFPAHTVS